MQHIKVEMPVVKKGGSERGELLQFFIDNIRDKNGDLYTAKRMAVKLAHCDVETLRYMKSCYKDTLKRRGSEAAGKEFNWSLRVKKVS